MGNSFGYLDAEGTRSFARNVLRSLRPGGRWVIDTGCAAESLLPHLREELRLEAGGIRFEVKNRYDVLEGRLVSECLLSRGDEREPGLFSHAVCTAAEIRRILEAEGGRVIAALGSCDDAPYAVGDRRLLLVAERAGRHRIRLPLTALVIPPCSRAVREPARARACWRTPPSMARASRAPPGWLAIRS